MINFLTIANIEDLSYGIIVDEGENKEKSDEKNSVNKEYESLKNENTQKDKQLRELENTYTEKIS